MSKGTYSFTTPIYYVNAAPHLGMKKSILSRGQSPHAAAAHRIKLLACGPGTA